ncbi:hypothetical protein [Acinetobacter baumannii]|uniref:hypothetical protein n=1 Tax=Acinetobacter baumannii TaxID=470 RepID=UPI002E18716F|nr:hypothetical protein [Acinetobacter baumannii]MEC6639376.1 hypothetical protein [Acinetobacter baumannii]MEC6738149.1 hypothetical protein [Acinetobacter baumannii]
MAKTPQSREELKKHLREQLVFLKSSNKSFDEGIHAEAKRLATTIRVLVHDTIKSESLLKQLGIKNSIKFINTAKEVIPGNLAPYVGLVYYSFNSNGANYKAPLHDGLLRTNIIPELDFINWWQQVVINDKQVGKFTRQDLVLSVANKDGGAHVGPSIDSSYAVLTRTNSLGFISSDGVRARPVNDIELHSIRQISFELFETLNSLDINNI